MDSKRFFKRPSKEETLASKQEAKARRRKYFRRKLTEFSPERWVRLGEAVGLAVLLSVNFLLLYPFFGREDKMNVFSAPVVPVLASMIEKWLPFAYSVRIWLLVFLIFFPLSFYYLVREISGRKLAAFLASLVVILPTGIFLPARVTLGLLSEDGGHVASLTFAPLVCLFLLRFLRKGQFWIGVFTALGTALVALSSPIGFLVLGIFMLVITFSEILLGQGRLKALRFLTILILAMGFSAFWYNPQFVFMTFQSIQGQSIRKTLINLLPISFFTLPLLGVFGFLLFENRPHLQSMFIAFFLTIAFGLFSLGAGVSHPSPSRFLPAFGISLAFLLGVTVTRLFDFLLFSVKVKHFQGLFPYRRSVALGLVVLIFVLITAVGFLKRNDFWHLEGGRVLGVINEQKTGIWEIREKTNRGENAFGCAITGLTVFSIGLIRRKITKS